MTEDERLKEPEAMDQAGWDRLAEAEETDVVYTIYVDVGPNRLEEILVGFGRLPRKDAGILLSDRKVEFVLPGINTVRKKHCRPHDTERVHWEVYFRTDLLDEPEESLVSIIAHELAHIFLEHESSYSGKAKARVELQADLQAVKWGFEKELRADPKSYLYGNGLDDLRQRYGAEIDREQILKELTERG